MDSAIENCAGSSDCGDETILPNFCPADTPFEIGKATIAGIERRIWKNAPTTLVTLARDATERWPEREICVFEGERLTYANWAKAVAALARSLQGMGVQQGDRIALAMRNLPEWIVVYFAAVASGAIVVPVNA